jgi:lipoyl(octanoyl) transferase
MRMFTAARTDDTPCELWLLEHPPVFTFGQGGRPEHLLDPGSIPVVRSDRGGQITYHGPGQLVAYTLFDLNRLGIGVRSLVNALEQSIIDVLADSGTRAARRTRAPGVYVDGAKIASIGLRVKRGRSYHGLSFNVDMDLAPFRRIDPCGFRGLPMCQCRDLGLGLGVAEAGERVTRAICRLLGYRSETADSLLPVGHPTSGGCQST